MNQPAANSELRRRAALGKIAFDPYATTLELTPLEKKQSYTVVDCVTDLLHYAASKGFDALQVVESAKQHYLAEVQGKD